MSKVPFLFVFLSISIRFEFHLCKRGVRAREKIRGPGERKRKETFLLETGKNPAENKIFHAPVFRVPITAAP